MRQEESREAYLVGRDEAGWSRNVKIRDGALEVKMLVERREGLERWRPAGRQELPLSGEFVAGPLGPDLGVGPLEARQDAFSLEDLVRRVIGTHSQLAVAWVEKRREHFEIGGCAVEIDEVRINGASLISAAAESEDAERLLGVMRLLEMEGLENVNYPRAIRRVMGMEVSPGQPWF
ncbi:hypothetical protein [Haloferula sargassicola]